MWKYQALIISLASSVAFGAVDISKFPSKTDPTQVTIPNIPQTTSHDVATECQYYQSNFTIDKTQWPTIWDIATSNNMNTSTEFTQLYNSIDWTKAPKAPVRSLTPEGGLNLVGYDTVNDPDCWWSATQCVKPKAAGANGDIATCPEPQTWGLVSDLYIFLIIYYNTNASLSLNWIPSPSLTFVTSLLTYSYLDL